MTNWLKGKHAGLLIPYTSTDFLLCFWSFAGDGSGVVNKLCDLPARSILERLWENTMRIRLLSRRFVTGPIDVGYEQSLLREGGGIGPMNPPSQDFKNT